MNLDPESIDYVELAIREAATLRGMGAFASVGEAEGKTEAPKYVFSETPDSISARFREVAAIFAGRPAIRTETSELSYEDLDIASDRVAAALLRTGFNCDLPIAVTTEDPMRFLIGILGVLKAGGFYVPLSHFLPEQRQAGIFAMVTPEIILYSGDTAFPLGSSIIDLQISKILMNQEAVTLPEIRPSEYCYVMFTSGSTGRPKGVLQRQASILHNSEWQTGALGISPEDRFSQLHSDATMGAVRATFNALLNGALLCPFQLSDGNLGGFMRWLTSMRPTVLHSAASFFRVFAAAAPDKEMFGQVRLVILGGEAVTESDFRAFRMKFPEGCLLCTGLGSTETTTVRMMLLSSKSQPEVEHGRLPLGFAVPCTFVGLIAPEKDEASGGLFGEMEIDGPSLFSGYWGETSAGQQRRHHPMGDVALLRPDGLLFHVGRKDHQVKIRGNRINLLEIENAVRAVSGVSDCVVLPYSVEGHDLRLHIFAVPSDPTALSTAKIRYFLRKQFPDYMQPSAIHLITSVPRLSGGKTNIAELRRYCAAARDGESALALHRQAYSSIEADLFFCFENTHYPFLRIWAERAEPHEVFLQSNIARFDIDSLTALEICLNIERKFGFSISPDALLRFRRVEHLLKGISEYV